MPYWSYNGPIGPTTHYSYGPLVIRPIGSMQIMKAKYLFFENITLVSFMFMTGEKREVTYTF